MQMASGLCLVAPIEDDRLQGKTLEHSAALSGRAALGGSCHLVAVQKTAATSLKQPGSLSKTFLAITQSPCTIFSCLKLSSI